MRVGLRWDETTQLDVAQALQILQVASGKPASVVQSSRQMVSLRKGGGKRNRKPTSIPPTPAPSDP